MPPTERSTTVPATQSGSERVELFFPLKSSWQTFDMRFDRRAWLWISIVLCVSLAGCGGGGAPAPPKQNGAGSTNKPVAAAPPRDEIPPDQLSAVIDAHYQGLGAMERYEYPAATRAFQDIYSRAPEWTIGTINLAIALLNQGGEAGVKAKEGDKAKLEQESILNIEAARRLLDEVIAKKPDQPHALFSRGIILRSQGDIVAAHNDFAKVARIDPLDAHNWLEYGGTLTDPERAGMPSQRKQAPELIEAYSKALEANPYLVTAMYKLQHAYNIVGDRDKQRKLYATYQKLNPKQNVAGSGELAATVYGEMGKYAKIIDPFPRPKPPSNSPPSPRFGPLTAIDVTLLTGDRWASNEDFVGKYAVIGRAKNRFAAGVATFDVNRDGRMDLYLTSAIIGPKGLRDALLVNQGEGKFEDQTAAYGLPVDRAGLGVAAADFDADFNVDLYLTGINDNRLFRHTGKTFEDVTQASGVVVRDAISLTARWFDIDQDGDLDLYVVNHCLVSDLEQAFVDARDGTGLANAVFRNDGKPSPVGMRPEDNWAPLAVATADLPAKKGLSIAFSTDWPALDVLTAGTGRHSTFAALDIDDDRDEDLVVTADDQPAMVLLNDRGGRFHAASLDGWEIEGVVSGLLVTDFDKDGRSDLVATCSGGRVFAWQNRSSRLGPETKIIGQSFPINARGWRSATTADLDLDTWSDLIGLPGPGSPATLEWSRNAGPRFESHGLAFGPVGLENRQVHGFTLANFIGDALPDLLICRDGEPPRIAPNLGNGLHWLAIDLSGRWKFSFDQMRTNSEGLGAKLSLEGRELYVPMEYSTLEAGTAQSVGPVVLGLDQHLNAPLLRVRWPDGVMQSELNVTANKTLNLVELNRKAGSCPILFTWNGARFECLGDFAGAAGLGFLEAPGEYHPPDRDEAMAISPDQLRDVDGTYRLSVVEPMDEVAYLDHLTLDVVDRPPGVGATPDERFAFGDSKPSGELIAWTRKFAPIAAQDGAGLDVLPIIRDADRRSVDQFLRINGWIGYTEEHSLILDFGDQLDQLKPGEEPVLCLTGWVEYPYSQTNYAAATSGLALKPPTLEQRLPDGRWRLIDPQPGHPAGLTRTMTVNLVGKRLAGPGCVLRLTTNMECYWDEAFIAVQNADALRSIRTSRLAVSNARIRDRGYLRESSPDGYKPALPDYDHVDPVPFARLRGELTRHGDVATLLQADDDQLCVMGPGDEVQLEFDARSLPPLQAGWTRSFVFRTIAYCKDADPFTATSDSVGPLPWRGMKGFPFPSGGERPLDPVYSSYLRDYQTRPAGER